MNAERKAAEMKMKKASEAVNLYKGNSESEFDNLWSEYQNAIKELVELEMKYPTEKEIRRNAEKLRLANMGIRD